MFIMLCFLLTGKIQINRCRDAQKPQHLDMYFMQAF